MRLGHVRIAYDIPAEKPIGNSPNQPAAPGGSDPSCGGEAPGRARESRGPRVVGGDHYPLLLFSERKRPPVRGDFCYTFFMDPSTSSPTPSPRSPSWALLLTALALAAGIWWRVQGLAWDQGLSYHPDEMNIALAVAKLHIPRQMHPDFFAYNGFSLYLYRLLAQGAALLTGDPIWTSDLGHITLLGRGCSAALSVLSLPLLFLLGRRTISPQGGWLALLLGAGCAGLIQAAHYSVTETLLVFWILLQALVAAHMVLSPTPCGKRSWALLGILWGLSLGTKTTAAILLVIPYTVLLLRLRQGDGSRAWAGALGGFLAGCAGALAVSPYSVLDFAAFRHSMEYETSLAKGTLLVPYTLQFLGTTPYLFFLKNIPWHLGPLLPLVSGAGIGGWALAMGRRRSSLAALPLLLFSAVYFAYVGGMFARFIRYLLPLYPALILAGAWALDALLRWGKARHAPGSVGAWAVPALVGSVVASGLLWGGAVASVFSQENPRTAASRWIYAQIPPGASLVVETWDYRLPAFLPDAPRKPYRHLVVPAPDPDDEAKARLLAEVLSQGDYYILASGRNADQLSRLPERYPLIARFYAQLRSGELGYREIRRFEVFPSLGGFAVDDRGAEETFRVFDHPTVTIYRNEEHRDAKSLQEVLWSP